MNLFRNQKVKGQRSRSQVHKV